MSCNVRIENKSTSTVVLTLLVKDGQPEGKGKVVFSKTLRTWSMGAVDVDQPSGVIGVTEKEYQQGEVVDLDILANSKNVDCRGRSVSATWEMNNMFRIEYHG